MKTRLLLLTGLLVAGFLLLSYHGAGPIFGEDAPDVTYDSPVGRFTLPTADLTAGTLNSDYKLATLAFAVRDDRPPVGDLVGNTGNGFSDRYDFENLNAFTLADAANNVGDLDNNPVPGPGGRLINPGFRFTHPTDRAHVWRIGSANDAERAARVIIFPSSDHLFDPEVPGYGPNRQNPPPGGLGNIVLEAIEFTVWGTDEAAEAQAASEVVNYFGVGGTGNPPPNTSWKRGVLVKVLAEGFKNYNGFSPFANRPDGFSPSPQEGDDFASVWEFRDASGNPMPVKYAAVYANKTRDARFYVPDAQGRIPGNLAQSTDAEIDAVGYLPFVAPPPLTASLSGRVINDANANGAIDAGELGIANVTVTLFNAPGTITVATTTTNATGDYSFTNLAPGSYRVVETNLPGYLDSGVIPGVGNTAINFNTISATLAVGQNSVENNFLDTLPGPGCPLPMFTAPEVVHGLATTPALSHGDLFLLSQPLKFTVVSPPAAGAIIFNVNPATFGGDAVGVGGFPGTNLQGLGAPLPGATVRGVSCTESFWDINFEIASTGNTVGDAVRLFVQNPNGTGVQTLATFAVQSGGVALTQLNLHISLFVNNRLAMGPGLNVGSFIPFTAAAGSAGQRTGLLTLAFSMSPSSPLMGCFQLGVDITRGTGAGTTSVVFTDIVVNRNQLPGDELNPGVGLLGGLGGGFPTGLPCGIICPPCPPGAGNGGGPAKCDTVCFHQPKYFLSRLGQLPSGSVMIGGVNFNNPVSTRNLWTIRLALLGGGGFGRRPLTPLQRLNQQFVAAQLSLMLAGGPGSPVGFNALWGHLSCYGLNFRPVTLSTGFTLTPDAMLMDLFQQAEFAIREQRTWDMAALADLFSLLGTDDLFGPCR